ncbi:MAG TPA: hypothetical protein VK726_26385 [Acetobacteraceae bacterium]|jgi:hypothetical protein|nr:hypothetical protein [Acetobacteraceae bacterium]
MLKRLLGLTLAVSLTCAGVAQAQSPAAPSGTATTKPSTTTPSMTVPMMGDVSVPNRPAGEALTASEVAAIGVGVVAGVLVFQGAMWHGMVIVGAALGGWAGDYIYNMHVAAKTEKTAS